jgi:hypothetical protein
MNRVDDLVGFCDVGDHIDWEMFGIIIHILLDFFQCHNDRFLNLRQELLRLLEL